MICAVLFASLFLTACMPEFDRDADCGRIGSGLTRRFLTQARELGFSLCGSGGAFSGGVYSLALYLDKEGCYTVEEARLIYVTAAERFLHLINQDLEARPYFHSYPATTDSLEFVIAFQNPDGTSPQPPYIKMVSVHRGDMFYSTVPNPYKRAPWTVVHKERYHEARQWVWENFPEELLKIYEGQ